MHKEQNLLFSSSITEIRKALDKKYNIDQKVLFSEEFFIDCKFSFVYDYRDEPDMLTALQYACLTEHEEIALLLIDSGANIHILDSQRTSILQMAALSNLVRVVDKIVDLVDINHYNRFGTALHVACRAKSTESALLLIDHGADINRDVQGFTPVQAACRYYNKQILTKMLQLPSQTVPLNDALFSSCMGNNVNPIKFLLSKGAALNHKDKFGHSLLHATCLIQGQSNKVGQYLIEEQGISVNSVDLLGNTPLHLACENHNLKMMALLIEHGADVNAPNRVGDTPLMHSARRKRFNLNLYKLMMKAHPDITIVNSNAKTLFDYITPSQKESLLLLQK